MRLTARATRPGPPARRQNQGRNKTDQHQTHPHRRGLFEPRKTKPNETHQDAPGPKQQTYQK